jgi:hypothetical protein
MILDLHVHSEASDDSIATLEAYLRWMRVIRKKHRFDGLVLTDHRAHNGQGELQHLSQEYEALILEGYEVETNCGHFLLFGADELASKYDFDDIRLDALELVRAAKSHGGIAVPSHPGRPNIGICDYAEYDELLDEIKVIERLNGGSRPDENKRATELAAKRGFFSVGGSDSHYVSMLGACLTEFDRPVNSIEDLVAELYAGRCRAIHRDDAPLA